MRIKQKCAKAKATSNDGQWSADDWVRKSCSSYLKTDLDKSLTFYGKIEMR